MGGSIWASKWLFSSHSVEPRHAPLIGQGIDWGGGPGSHCGLGRVQVCKKSGERGQNMVTGALREVWLGSGGVLSLVI